MTNIDDRINNLLKIAQLHQENIEKNTSDIAALLEVVKSNSEDIKVLQLTVQRLTEGYHNH